MCLFNYTKSSALCLKNFPDLKKDYDECLGLVQEQFESCGTELMQLNDTVDEDIEELMGVEPTEDLGQMYEELEDLMMDDEEDGDIEELRKRGKKYWKKRNGKKAAWKKLSVEAKVKLFTNKLQKVNKKIEAGKMKKRGLKRVVRWLKRRADSKLAKANPELLKNIGATLASATKALEAKGGKVVPVAKKPEFLMELDLDDDLDAEILNLLDQEE